MKTRQEMELAVAGALAKSSPLVGRRSGAAEVAGLVAAREKLHLIQTRQRLGLRSGFNLSSLRASLAKHDSAIQELHDLERARECTDPIPILLQE